MPKTELNPAYMQEVSKGFSKVFVNALKTQNEDYKKIALSVKSNVISQNYSWLGDLSGMREWTGDRIFNSLTAFDYTIKKKDWEKSIEVDRDVIAYDNLGFVKPQIQSLAEMVSGHYNSLVFGLLEQNGQCFDGKTFFAKDHSVGSATFSNSLEFALTQENFIKARGEMKGLVNDSGQPLFIRPNLLIVPPELEMTALKILKADTLDNGASNITKDMCELLVCDWLSDEKAWYLLDTTRTLKPLILQINKEVEFVAQDKADSESVFMRKKFRYGIDTEDNAGYGLWQLALKSKPA